MTTMSLRVKYTFLEFCEDRASVASSRSLSAGCLRGTTSSSLSPMCGATIAQRPAFAKKRWSDYEEDDVSTDIGSDRDSLDPAISETDFAASLPALRSNVQMPWSWEHGTQESQLWQQQHQQPSKEQEKQQRQKRQKKQKQKQQEQQKRQQLISPLPYRPLASTQGLEEQTILGNNCPTFAQQQEARHVQAPCQLVTSKQTVISNQRMSEDSDVVSSPPRQNGIKQSAVMIRNIPCTFGRQDVIATLNNLGFKGTFDVVFLPMTVTSSANFGYVFVNCLDLHHADHLTRVLQGCNFGTMDAEKCCEVTPAKEHGRSNLARHVRRFNAKRNSMPIDVFSDISDRPHDLFE